MIFFSALCGYPKMWPLGSQQEYWNEQYLLHALLIGNPRTHPGFGTVYHRLVNPQRLEALMGGKFPVGGSSFWFHLDASLETRPRPAQFQGLEANLQKYLEEDSVAPLAARAASVVPPVMPNVQPRDARQSIAAVEFDASSALTSMDGHIGSLDHGDWVRYPRINFAPEISRVNLELATPPNKAGQTE